MNSAVAIFAVLAVLAGAASLYARGAWWRVGAFAMLLVSVCGLWLESTGVVAPAFLPPPAGLIAGYELNEPDAIYLWILEKGRPDPIAVALPWSEKKAEELVRAADRARDQGRLIRIYAAKTVGRHLMGFSLSSVRFGVVPMRAMPPKRHK